MATMGRVGDDADAATRISSAERFASERYVMLPGLVAESLYTLAYRHAMDLAASGKMKQDDQVDGAPCAYADPIMEMLLERLLPSVEAASGLRLFPTYSFLRIYHVGDDLSKHRDRQSCEISVSVALGSEGGSSWPLWIEGPSGPSAVHMNPGDALLYHGIELTHWREPFDGDHAVQVFLHYVDQNGPFAEWKYDKRPHQSEKNDRQSAE